MPHHPTPAARTQRGAATLAVTLALFAAMALTVVYVHRNLVFEQRASANQVRATQAFEAAEAGLEWAQAQLDAPGRIGTDCRPSADATAPTFREHYLVHGADGTITPATTLVGGAAAPRDAACVRSAAGWQCDCPASGAARPAPPEGSAPAPAFRVRFVASGTAGVVRVHAVGCSGLAGDCAPASGTPTDATAQLDVALGRLPGLRTPPAAALTVRGSLDAGSAALAAHHADAARGGLALHTGGALAAPQARIEGPAGSVSDDAVVAGDAALAALDPAFFFSAHFGMPIEAWTRQPVVGTVRCAIDCAAVLQAAFGPGVSDPLVHVDGDLALDGPAVFGTPERPVAIVVDGEARLRGAITVHGVLYARALRWDDADAGALVRGAALVEGDYRGNAAPTFAYDAAVLARLVRTTGSHARVNGSWRDF